MAESYQHLQGECIDCAKHPDTNIQKPSTEGAIGIMKYEMNKHPDTAREQQMESRYISDMVPRKK